MHVQGHRPQSASLPGPWVRAQPNYHPAAQPRQQPPAEPDLAATVDMALLKKLAPFARLSTAAVARHCRTVCQVLLPSQVSITAELGGNNRFASVMLSFIIHKVSLPL